MAAKKPWTGARPGSGGGNAFSDRMSRAIARAGGSPAGFRLARMDAADVVFFYPGTTSVAQLGAIADRVQALRSRQERAGGTMASFLDGDGLELRFIGVPG